MLVLLVGSGVGVGVTVPPPVWPPLFPLSLGVVGCTGCSDEEEPVFSVALLSVLGVVVSVVCCVLDSVAELELAGACASVVEEEATGASAFTSALAGFAAACLAFSAAAFCSAAGVLALLQQLLFFSKPALELSADDCSNANEAFITFNSDCLESKS